MKTPGRDARSTIAVVVIAVAIVIGGSIGLVRWRNGGRQLTPAITWAAESLLQIPDSVAAAVFPLDAFAVARQRFCTQLRGGTLPVDSVRSFYQAYALWVRDGVMSAEDVVQLGRFLGLSPDLEQTLPR
ncbi:MAG: hypothetical protein AB1792_10760 [Candidatus Zixiibacteriota bacterium]